MKFSLQRQMAPNSTAAAAATLRRTIKSIDVVDDLTVNINTTTPQIGLPPSLSRAVAPEGAVMPKAYIEKVGEEEFRRKPIGSGPWRFVRSVPGDRIEFEAVDYPHWRGTPHFKNLHILLVPEESTRIAMVRTGEAAIASIGPDTMLSASRGGLEVLSVPGTMQALYQFWGTYRPEFKDSPIANPRVRQALSLAIDRQAIIDQVMNGLASMPYPFATFRYTEYFSADRWEKWAKDAYRYDPVQAKKMLAEAGYPNGFDLNFANTALPGTQFMVDVGTAVVDMWTKIGVRVKLTNYEWGSFAPLVLGDQAQSGRQRLDVSHRRATGRAVALQWFVRLGQRPASARRQGHLRRDLPGLPEGGQGPAGGARSGEAHRADRPHGGTGGRHLDRGADHRGHGLLRDQPAPGRAVRRHPGAA